MKEIPLTQGKVALVDDADYEAVMQFKWQAIKDAQGRFRACRHVYKLDGTRTSQRLHQFLMPGVPMVDHKDGDALNNLRENLRPCTYSQNGGNRRPRKGHKFKGTTWNRRLNLWVSMCTIKGRQHYLGSFKTEEDAARAYDLAAKKYHGEFAWLNFPVHNTTQLPS